MPSQTKYLDHISLLEEPPAILSPNVDHSNPHFQDFPLQIQLFEIQLLEYCYSWNITLEILPLLRCQNYITITFPKGRSNWVSGNCLHRRYNFCAAGEESPAPWLKGIKHTSVLRKGWCCMQRVGAITNLECIACVNVISEFIRQPRLKAEATIRYRLNMQEEDCCESLVKQISALNCYKPEGPSEKEFTRMLGERSDSDSETEPPSGSFLSTWKPQLRPSLALTPEERSALKNCMNLISGRMIKKFKTIRTTRSNGDQIWEEFSRIARLPASQPPKKAPPKKSSTRRGAPKSKVYINLKVLSELFNSDILRQPLEEFSRVDILRYLMSSSSGNKRCKMIFLPVLLQGLLNRSVTHIR